MSKDVHTQSKPPCPRESAASEAAKPLVPFALSPALAIGRRPSATEMELLVRLGFRALVNNSPDGELHAPMTSAQYAAEAQRLGLGYQHVPVEGRNPLEKDIRAFAVALSSLPSPIFACCHSGGRSCALWALASVEGVDSDTLIAKCADAGFDVSGLKSKMDMRREMLKEGEVD